MIKFDILNLNHSNDRSSMHQRTSLQVLLIIGVALILRLINLNQSLWLDEAIEVLAVKNNSYVDLVRTYTIGDFHPPLFHFILKFWDSIFGYSEVVSRFPSVIFGVLTVFFVYKIGQMLGGKKVGLLAGLFLALNPLAIYYSQEARMYSLAACAVTAAVFFFLKQKWFLYGLMMLIAIYADYLPFLMFPVFFLLTKNRYKFIIYHSLFIIFALPWAPFFLEQLKIGLSVARDSPLWGQIVGGFDIKALPLTFVKFAIGRISFENKILYGIIVAPITVVYGWLIFKAKDKFLWIWLLAPLIIGFIVSAIIPIYSYFRFIFVLPAFVLLLAKGVENSGHRTVFILLAIVVSLVSTFYFNFNSNFHREDWRSLVSNIKVDRGVVLIPNLAQAAPLNYYDQSLIVEDKSSMKFSGSTPVYYLPYVQEIFDPNNTISNILILNGYVQVEEKRFPGLVLYKYRL